MKKVYIIFCLIICFCFSPVLAKTHTQTDLKHTEYMNIAFWEKFNDETLVENLYRVYENNRDLKAAVLKVNQAERVVKMSFANELPHIGFEGYAGRTFRSSDQRFGNMMIPDYTQSHFLFPVTMNYEIDIWGQNRLRTKYKQKELEMVQQDERAAYIFISSAFACYYYDMIQIDKLIESQAELVDLQEKVVKAIEKEYEIGTATLNDIEIAKKEYTFLKENLVSFSGKRDAIRNQLNILLGNKNFDEVPRGRYDDIDINLTIPKAVDADAMVNRPDRIKAELNLKRMGIDVKIAKRDFLPKFILTGDLGFNFYNLSTNKKFLADLGIIPAWDIFMGGRKIQMLKYKKASYDLAIEHYEKTILTSFQETDDALFYLKTLAKVRAVVDDRLLSEEKQMKYAEIKERNGVADELDLLFRKQKLIIAQQQAMNAKINEIISAINLYNALGGVDYSLTPTTEKL